MSDQLSLMGFDAPARPTDRLFFAIFPDAQTADRIARLAMALRGEHGLQGQPLKTERFHITLHHLGDHVGVPRDIVASASQAAEALRQAPFDLCFDQAMSFSGKPGKRPFVLRGGDGLTGLIAFQQALGAAMTKVGLGRWVDQRFTPHVTLLYDAHGVAEQAVEPITWTASRFVLVHSLLGQTRHVPLASWVLQG